MAPAFFFGFPGADTWTANNVNDLSFLMRKEWIIGAGNTASIFLQVVRPIGFGLLANGGGQNQELLGPIQNDPDFQGEVFVSEVDGDANDVGEPITTQNGNSFEADAAGDDGFVVAGDFVGWDEIHYTVSDGTTSKNVAVAFYVPETDPYTVEPEFSMTQDASLDVRSGDYSNALLDCAGNFDDENLAITEVNGEENLLGVSADTAESGSVIVWANGGFSYTAPVNFVGQDSFSVTFDDGTTTLSMTVTLNVVNTYALDAGYSTLKNQTLTQVAAGGLLDFAGDVDDDTITVTKVGGSSNNVGVAFTTNEGGTATIQSTGAFVYVPPADFSGEDSATYTISDGDSESTATIRFFVVQALALDADYPVTLVEGLSVAANEGLLTFAGEADDDPLTVTAVNGSEDLVGEEFETEMGSITIYADGSFDYVPAEGVTGFDHFSYTISNGTDTSTANFTLAVVYPLAIDADFWALMTRRSPLSWTITPMACWITGAQLRQRKPGDLGRQFRGEPGRRGCGNGRGGERHGLCQRQLRL